MLEALTFDFWGTLYHGAYGVAPRIALIQAALTRHGVSCTREDLLAAYDRAWSVVDQAWRNQHRSMPVSDWLDVLLDAAGVVLPRETRDSMVIPLEEVLLSAGEGPVLVSGAGEAVARLAGRYRLGLISDVGLTPGRVLRAILNRSGLLHHFDTLTFSDEAGATKPEREVFLRTVEALGSSPERAAHIGDLPETDIAGARAVGMQAVLFLGVSGRSDGLALADASFEDYGELEAVLLGLGGQAG